MFDGWWILLFIKFIYTTRYFSASLNFLEYPFRVSMLASPIPRFNCIHSILHDPHSSNVEFKVVANTSGRINLNISSPVRSIASSRLLYRKDSIGFPWCLFDIPLPKNIFSSIFLICAYFESKWPRKLHPYFSGLFLHPQPQLSHKKLFIHAEHIMFKILVNLWLDVFDTLVPFYG